MKNILLGVALFFSFNGAAQETMMEDTTAVHSIDGIVNEVLRMISSEKGKTRNWTAFRSLFLPTATFSVHTHDESEGMPIETVSLDEFLEFMHDPYYDEGFVEYEISKVVNEYNGIAQVFQTYHGKDVEGYEETGITSYQLVSFDDRWWIANVIWTGDSNGVAVPKEYLGNE